ncbi:MAG TPA: tRNA-intron lyase [Euryarchaeota archaeon]|nr:tRNA-intron lyase [Euryarchaeota archaeon]
MRAEMLGKRVLVPEGYSELVQKGYGERKSEGLVLSLYEAAYLLEKGKLDVFKDGKQLKLEEFLGEAEREEPEFFIRYNVFKDMRDRGYVIKTGFKFGTHFRVYPRGKKPGEAHTEFTVQVMPEEKRLEVTDISRLVRLARAIRTRLVLAVVDSENEIVYYEIKRISP